MAKMNVRDALIVGAGPAGAVCAAYLARAGLDVLLIDKEMFPRNKVCGDMVREGMAKHIVTLEAVDVLDEMSCCVRRLKLIAPSGEQAIVPFECYVLPRFKLDKLLVDTAVSWGVEFRQGARLEDVIIEDGKVCGAVVREKGVLREVRSLVVIGADGVGSDVARIVDGASAGVAGGIAEGGAAEGDEGMWLGLRGYFKGVRREPGLVKEQYDAGGIFGFDGKPGPAYFWALPTGADGVEKGIYNVGMVVKGRDEHHFSELTERMEAWLVSDEICEMFEGAEQVSPWEYGRLADKSAGRKAVGDGYILIGDAAAVMTPLINDGLSAAADSGKAAADAVEAAFKSADFSKEFLEYKYMVGDAKRPAECALEDKAKLDRLLMESMRDPKTMDMIIERLARDPNYRKLV